MATVETIRADGTILYEWLLRLPGGSGSNDHTRIDATPFPPGSINEYIGSTGPGRSEEFTLPSLTSTEGLFEKIRVDKHLVAQAVTMAVGIRTVIKLLGVVRLTIDLQYGSLGYETKTAEFATVPFDVAEYNAAAAIGQATGYFELIDGGGLGFPDEYQED
jgi:hypothetical protein